MKKVLLDTDIGSDIDDAIALAYLLAQPECELLGITTVSGQSLERAMLCDAQCKAAGRDIPIFPGVEPPIHGPQRQPIARQYAALERWPHRADFPRGEAVEFLRRTIRQHPGEVTLISIGPLTNVGLLFAVDPEIPGLLKELVMMCGVFTYQMPNIGPIEWNARCDPDATAIVYRAPVKVHRSIGLDVTFQVTMSVDEMKERFAQAPLLRPVLDFAKVWADNNGQSRLVYHDPLAAATVFDDGICRFERGDVTVDLDSKVMTGITYWEKNAAGAHEVALQVDRDGFFRHYFDAVNAYKC